jgi:hypothetical protein
MSERKPGRPQVAPPGSRFVNVSLSPELRERAKRLGGGNLAAGVRLAIASIDESMVQRAEAAAATHRKAMEQLNAIGR